ncbi:phosphatidate cytidylyltransferase [symbiont of Argiope bruennichi]|uniref:phosphatidate cytidylyltransferase n=1 Tax=symbiont of Argiope bruennichi TaxID=2810479 RepID=UPI003DA51CB0
MIFTLILFLVFISHLLLAISLYHEKPNSADIPSNVISPFWTLLYLFLTNFVFDISAYLFSCFYKKEGDLAPKISKNKTKKAFLFGTAVSFLTGAIFAFTYSLLNKKTFVSFLYNNGDPLFAVNLTLIIFISLFIPITAQLGDLFFSKVKRENQIKDFSRALSAHGGVLDRFDSLIFSLSFFFLIFLIFNYNWFFISTIN